MEQQHEHIVRSYEEELLLLNNKIAKMGGLAEQVLGQSFEALERRDPELAAATIKKDEEIDTLQKAKTEVAKFQQQVQTSLDVGAPSMQA